MTSSLTHLINFGVWPLVWCGVVSAILTLCRPKAYDDSVEKLALLTMVSGYMISGLTAFAQIPYEALALPLPDWQPETDLFAAIPPTAEQNSEAVSIWPFAVGTLALVYVAGLTFHGGYLIRGLWQLLKIDRNSLPDQTNGIHAAAGRFSAFASPTGKIIVSQDLKASLSPLDLRMIVAHETSHLKRHDPALFITLAILDCLFWFNPFLRRQTANCRLAAELACDADVLRAAPEMRSVYAKSLVSALKHTAGNALHCVPAAFSKPSKGDYRMRMNEIMRPSGPVSKSLRLRLVAGLSLLLIPVGTLQMAFAQTTAIASGFEMASWPIDGRISSSFGERVHPVSKKPAFHSGIDLAAAKGTPVMSASAGVVTRAEFSLGYGNLVDVDHGNGFVTRYSQLDTIGVDVGEAVSNGQTVGTVGMSGRDATGPHLHFEVLKDGKATDPASYFKS